MKKNKLLAISMIVVYAAMLSFLLVANTFAKYTSSTTSSGNISAAKFDVTISNNFNEVFSVPLSKMRPGDVKTVTINVKSNSQVDLKCTIETQTLGYLPLVIENGSITEDYAVGEITKTYLIVIKWPVELNNYIYSSEIDAVNISIVVTQP